MQTQIQHTPKSTQQKPLTTLMNIFGIPLRKGSHVNNKQQSESCKHPEVIVFTCTKEQAMVPLLSWFSRVSHTATSGTLVTPSVIIMIPGTHTSTSETMKCE